MICNLCPRRCNALRTESENVGGFCGMPLLPRLARAALHFWEEPVISGAAGSGTVFFSGCNLGCIYCQNAPISHGGRGKTVSVSRLAEIFRELEGKGAANINLVTPTHYTRAIKSALDIYRPGIPIVYNGGGYESTEQLIELEDYVDVYLLDYKYCDPQKAQRYSAAPDYPETARAAITEAYRQKGRAVIKNGLMKSGVIVRHLLLPRATADAIEIFDFVRKNVPGAYFSLMCQYTPMGSALDDKVINRRVTRREYDKVAEYIAAAGFENCFVQEANSATKDYIPDFDLCGI